MMFAAVKAAVAALKQGGALRLINLLKSETCFLNVDSYFVNIEFVVEELMRHYSLRGKGNDYV